MNLCVNEKGTEPFVDENPTQDVLNHIESLKKRIGDELLILGHHYQQDEIIRFADKTGDSYELSKYASQVKNKKYIVFCGVHFMAETADILTEDHQIVILPDLAAGCSMADMASIDDVETAYDIITANSNKKLIPITYVNSSADIKAFVGKNGGIVCTSSNAKTAIEWAFNRGEQLIFLPDQHLGRNTAYKMGIPLEKMIIWDPRVPKTSEILSDLSSKKVILWKGHCSVHMNFRPEHIDLMKEKYPDVNVIVHPECMFDVVQKADIAGSTSFIIKTIENAPAGSRWAVGTEHHLVQRLQKRFSDKIITTLAPFTCQCATMYRISPEMLEKTLIALSNGTIINRIQVEPDIKKYARMALERMLEI
jgi:quinolinate synthase